MAKMKNTNFPVDWWSDLPGSSPGPDITTPSSTSPDFAASSFFEELSVTTSRDEVIWDPVFF